MKSTQVDGSKTYWIGGPDLATLLALKEKVEAMKGEGGVKVTLSDKNIIISIGGAQTGPDGVSGKPTWVALGTCNPAGTFYGWGWFVAS